ncbi:PP2C family protein-serine/threonine phosphatase [Fodinicurvata sediminis]|uniref:PP2C family protein-serine/threonine phosphatase n=1 Tax=Fodinicurvata sediminis TaxID=1121832 RepID=UPI0003B676A8|nr:protein phosphatase 2C domain-containing protein [Fodinicurvata sediminis]
MKFKQLSIGGPKGQNQDAILAPIKVKDTYWCAIADGVGSAKQGGLAARASLERVSEIVDSEISMSDVFAEVSRRLSELSSEYDKPMSFSTTLSLLCVGGQSARLGHVGDTRITHYRDGGVMTRTKDQTEVQKLLDDGVLSKNQARRYPRRNVLLSAMSAGRDYDLFQATFEIERGDRILLTSDGFHSKLLRPRIAEISSLNPSFDDFWQALEGLITQASLDDDASCLAIEVD